MRGLFEENPLKKIEGSPWKEGEIRLQVDKGYSVGCLTVLNLFSNFVHRCCRAHDLCPYKIRKLSSAFGIVNTRPHTALHCACDESFRICLQVQLICFSIYNSCGTCHGKVPKRMLDFVEVLR